MQILIVEDEKRVADFICKGLRVEGYFCEQAHNGQSGLVLVNSHSFDVIILDRMLPDTDGISFLKHIRNAGISTPVLFLTALDDIEEKVHGLRAGADDYLTKPFDFEELLARIEVLSRRGINGPDVDENIIKLNDISISLTHRTVYKGNELIKMTTMEFDLLLFLAKSKGRVLSRERILNAVWQLNSDPLTNVVDVYINRLRKKFDIHQSESFIETLRGVGYRLNIN
ncbi:MAG: response regulator transcription factor [Methylophaga sp.]|uniref:response regulator transcription factor n=1 Tax=Methylophaga sp. TaxID=2024840 RepID=UPI00299DE70B|nr:response regulator transcription factor [Methylophaga sp.]MDX1750542.1 response regulator transcription factor [Methylophaga sp.]